MPAALRELIAVVNVTARAGDESGLRQSHRTAETELIILQRKRLETIDDVTAAGEISVVGNVAVENIIADKNFCIPLEFLRSALEHGIDHAAHRLPVLGIERPADDLHLLEQ